MTRPRSPGRRSSAAASAPRGRCRLAGLSPASARSWRTRATGCARPWRGSRGPGTRTGTSGARAPASPARSIPVSSRSRASGCSAVRYPPIAAPSRRPVPDSAATTHLTCGNAPSLDWFDGGRGLAVRLLVQHIRRGPVHRDDAQPAAEDPPAMIGSYRACDLRKQVTVRVRPELGAAPRQGGGIRQPPLPSLPGIHPHPRCRRPSSRSAPSCRECSPSASFSITCPYPQFLSRKSQARTGSPTSPPGEPPPLLPRPRRIHASSRATA